MAISGSAYSAENPRPYDILRHYTVLRRLQSSLKINYNFVCALYIEIKKFGH